MISVSLKGVTFPLWTRQVGEKQPLFKDVKARFNLSKLLSVLGISAVVIGTVLLLMAVGALPTVSKLTHKAGSSQHAAPKPHIVSSAVVDPGCQDPQANAIFASCPSFLLDFGKQRNGSVDNKIFNVYTGAPEANHEAQYYSDSSQNLRIENGNLVLQALNTPQQGFKYTSARIDTKGKADFLYGKLVVRATVPSGVGSWPAIWMLPTAPKYLNMSPDTDESRYLNDGEIDLMEAIGTQPNVVYGIAHSRAYPEDGPDRSYYNTIRVPGNDKSFHNYAVDWTPTSITFSVDSTPYFTMNKQPGADYRSWPYDQPFYLILNYALGGSWGGTDTAHFPGDGVNPNILPSSMNVQSVKYYPYIGPR
jgi:beta-glucanase (GH16 family)